MKGKKEGEEECFELFRILNFNIFVNITINLKNLKLEDNIYFSSIILKNYFFKNFTNFDF